MPKQSRKQLIKDKSVSSTYTNLTKLRPKVQCYCKKCNGNLVETRTRKKHEEKELHLLELVRSREKKENQRQVQNLRLRPEMVEREPIVDSSFQKSRDEKDISTVDNDQSMFDDEINIFDIELVVKKKNDQFKNPFDLMVDEEQPDRPANLSSEENDMDDDDDGDDVIVDDDEIYQSEPEQFINEEELPAEPEFNNLDYESENLNTNINFSDSWILLWIFKFQERFKLSDVAVNSLISFFGLVLKDADSQRFNKFPSTGNMARNFLDIKKKPKVYAVCPECNKLYNVANITPNNSNDSGFSGFKCNHIEFPNHPMQSQRKSCATELLTKVPVVNGNGYIWRPKLIYPLPSLKTQLVILYRRPGFEELLMKWTNRNVTGTGLMSDIYDGEIWKNFPSRLDVSDPPKFFTPETADSHIGIMINLDWFQPFDSSVYSCGAIYGVICNLPREVRFKKENMLTLALLPGPNEVKLHRINHYLAPIIDELLDLWKGFNLPISDRYPTGKNIRLAVICCTNDIPAARKLCGHISAISACHRCYKTASSKEGERANFGGFDDMDDWFRMRDPREHRRNAMIWKHQLTKDDRQSHVIRTHVRWSEMLRLPYFDPIRFLVVDPMHNLFLGLAQRIVKKLWIEKGKITKVNLELMEKRAKQIKVPADIGRIPYKIATGDGFSGFTADQWKSFIMIYAIPIMWDLLDEADRRILANFVRACYLLVSRIIDEKKLSEAHSRLLTVARLIENNYGPEAIVPNIHLSLHITECCRDYGPLYSFWCYSFERMNGILGSFPNSNRQIETELLRIIMQNWRLDELISCQSNNLKLFEGLELLKSRPTIGSLAVYDNFQSDELHQFMLIYNLEVEQTVTGREPFPGEMMTPRKLAVDLPNDIYDLLVDYYSNAYDLEFVTIASIGNGLSRPNGRIFVRPQINQFGRIRIGAEIFGSAIAPRYLKNSFILAKFVQENSSIEIYPGQVQYFFEHEIRLPGGKESHKLAFVKWYKPAPNHQTRFYFQVDGDINVCNVELWENEFYDIDRDSIIPIHNIYSRFIPSKFIIGHRKPVTYMAEIPINRCFH